MKLRLLGTLCVYTTLALANTASHALDPLVKEGLRVFTEETFDGNGRTCATCHRLERNTTIDPEFIATLPPDDPLFVAESNPDLADLENSILLRQFGLFKTSPDPALPNFRSTSHTLALRTSIESSRGPALGWAGVSEGEGTLREFAIGAIRQHFPRTLARIEGVDFRLPTDAELDAMEAFQFFLGRQTDLSLPLNLVNNSASQGQTLFLDDNKAKCNVCHINAGADIFSVRNPLGRPFEGNETIDTAVENLSLRIAAQTGVNMPTDIGDPRDGRAGKFNMAPLVEAADTTPLFHNHGAQTLRDAIAFYTSADFTNSADGSRIVGPITLSDEEIGFLAAFLTVLNADENLRQAVVFLQEAIVEQADPDIAQLLVTLAIAQLEDAIRVLGAENLHNDVQQSVQPSIFLLQSSQSVDTLTQQIATLNTVRNLMVSRSTSNQAPIVDGGPDQTVIFPAQANLNGTVSDDGLPEGGTLTLTWSQVSGPATATFANAAAEDTTASFPALGTYVLRLTANDSELSASSDLNIQIVDSGGSGEALDVTGVSPTEIAAGSTTTVSISGTGFLDGASLLVCRGGVTLGPVIVVNSNTIQVDASVDAGRDPGPCGIRVTNPDGAIDTLRNALSTTAGGDPGPGTETLTITGVSPNTVAAATTATLTVTGTGFESGATATACRTGGVTLDTVEVLDSNTIELDVTVDASRTPGSCGLSITRPDGERAVLRNAFDTI